MTKSIRSVDKDGTVRWRLPDGKFHRLDGPALEWPDGIKEWYLNGIRHREDGPALEYQNGRKEWYLNGERHHLDGPAIEDNEYKAWYLDGKFHREDGPAIEYPDGTRSWYLNGCGLVLTNRLKISHPTLYNQMLIYEVMKK